MNNKPLKDQVRLLPPHPGVYLFKNEDDEIVYIGKAKNLKSRVSSYFHNEATNVKSHLIVTQSVTLDHIVTQSELEAMLLEAKLIQRHQPCHNVLLKDGQPFLYIMITTGSAKTLPKLEIVRNRKKRGSYFGPFIEKGSVRQVYDFLLKTFRLKICGKKIQKGCLYYHMGICSGSCRDDFNQQAYLEGLELARTALKKGHKKFLIYLQELIDASNEDLTFERSKRLHEYYRAFEKVFTSLDTNTAGVDYLASIDIWILTEDNKALFLFTEKDSVLKKKREFIFTFDDFKQLPEEYLLGYYRVFAPAASIILNFELQNYNQELFGQFLQQWHNAKHAIDIMIPKDGHFYRLMRLAQVKATAELEKKINLSQALKRMLKLPIMPHSIDCFDISHKQGLFLVGSCIRFVDGKPDKNNFRRFKIKTVHQNDDYASLREVVSRRYKDTQDLPDLVLIDGGKGQLNAVQDLFPELEFISLAKREETIFSKRFPDGKVLNQTSYAAQTLISLRDYAHHFAVTYHRSLAKIR